MRAIILAAVVAVGFGLAAAPAANAAPASGLGISQDAGNGNITKVQHWRWGSRRHWRMCHRRHHSRMYRCW